MQPKKIGIFPASAAYKRKRLFQALENAFPVQFSPYDPVDPHRVDALLILENRPKVLRQASLGGLRSFVVLPGAEETFHGRVYVDFSQVTSLDSRLRNRTLEEHDSEPLGALNTSPENEILASCCGYPIWIVRHQGPARFDIVHFLTHSAQHGKDIGPNALLRVSSRDFQP